MRVLLNHKEFEVLGIIIKLQGMELIDSIREQLLPFAKEIKTLEAFKFIMLNGNRILLEKDSRDVEYYTVTNLAKEIYQTQEELIKEEVKDITPRLEEMEIQRFAVNDLEMSVALRMSIQQLQLRDLVIYGIEEGAGEWELKYRDTLKDLEEEQHQHELTRQQLTNYTNILDQNNLL